MFQLNFYPHIDLHHAAFRAVCLSRRIATLPLDAYRLADFYLTFPFELGMIRLRGAKLKKLAAHFEKFRPYRWSSDPLQTFLQMMEFQTVAVRALARERVIDRSALEEGLFSQDRNFELNGGLAEKVEDFLAERGAIVDAILEIIRDHGVSGKDGLKARTGLMPFRYDPEADVVLD
jgi:hypothetical protein